METQNHRIALITTTETDNIQGWIENLLTDRRVSNLTPRTVLYYREKLTKFLNYCSSQGIEGVQELNPQFLRAYFENLALTHNAGGSFTVV
jgi:site-specific recombinase XerD